MTSLKESIKRMLLEARGAISSKNYDEWAEGYIKELEHNLPPRPTEDEINSWLSIPLRAAFVQGYTVGLREVLRFLRGEI